MRPHPPITMRTQEEWRELLTALSGLHNAEVRPHSVIEVEYISGTRRHLAIVTPHELYVDGWLVTAHREPQGWPWLRLKYVKTHDVMSEKTIHNLFREREKNEQR